MPETWAVIDNGIVAEACDAHLPAPWWSFTKTILSAAALALVRDGVLALDEPLSDRPYTLRRLLQHRSGLANYGGFPAYHEAVARGDEPWPVPALLAHVDAYRLRYAPGEGWEYSNIGYLFVRQLIETKTGDNLDKALQKLVLRPLGINGAWVALKPADLEPALMGSARTYHPGWVYHGLLVGPVEEAAKLLVGLLTGDLLPPEMLEDMLTPFVLPGPVPDRPWKVPGYGLGVMTGETKDGQRVVGHTGGGPGSTIAVYRSLQGGSPRTAAVFRTSEDQAKTEEMAFEFLTG
jgi:CubicO group peptidase (beta-lactamase class C family)